MGARHDVRQADEAAKRTVLVGVARKDGDSPAAELMQAAAVPVGQTFRVEVRGDQTIEGRDVGLVVGRAEEAVERVP